MEGREMGAETRGEDGSARGTRRRRREIAMRVVSRRRRWTRAARERTTTQVATRTLLARTRAYEEAARRRARGARGGSPSPSSPCAVALEPPASRRGGCEARDASRLLVGGNSGDGSVRPRARRRPWEGKETRYAETRTRGGTKHARRARASICARHSRARPVPTDRARSKGTLNLKSIELQARSVGRTVRVR